MPAAGGTRPGSPLWGVAVLAVAAADLAIQEAYHQMSSTSVGLVVLVVSAVLVLAASALTRLLPSGQLSTALVRGVDLAVLLVAGYWLLWPVLADTWHGAGTGPRLVMGLALVAAPVLVLRAAAATWARMRIALLVAVALFVGSEPVLGALQARPLDWPPGLQAQDAAADAGRVATLVLLLDELNAGSAGPIVEVLRGQGLQVSQRAVPSVGDGTARVLPAMFTGQLFDAARPCGPTTICSGQMALDFGRVRATRPDIDVVGFYHPYCAMQGLRSCARAHIGLAFFDSMRWRCGVWRRTGWPLGVDTETCRASAVGGWVGLNARLLANLRQAPTLASGGLLFAHLALPHPPGHPDDGSLQQHYQANLRRAADVVREALATAAGHGLALRVLVFSDHPLRQVSWCRGYPGFFAGPCVPDARLDDDKVPLIVAGSQVPDLAAHTSNLRVFGLLAHWPPR